MATASGWSTWPGGSDWISRNGRAADRERKKKVLTPFVGGHTVEQDLAQQGELAGEGFAGGCVLF
jgi:hypothetical protein